jgi:hypothetical protein
VQEIGKQADSDGISVCRHTRKNARMIPFRGWNLNLENRKIKRKKNNFRPKEVDTLAKQAVSLDAKTLCTSVSNSLLQKSRLVLFFTSFLLRVYFFFIFFTSFSFFLLREFGGHVYIFAYNLSKRKIFQANEVSEEIFFWY